MTKAALFFRSFLFFNLLSLLICIRGYGQPYVCTDVSPDLVSTGNASADIDLNNDAVIDFRLTGISVPSVNIVIAQASQIGLGNSVLSDGSGNALALSFGTSIGSSSTAWHQMNSGNLNMLYVINGNGSGPWLGATDQYLGLQLAVGTNTFYGWARLSFSSSINTYTLMDYAYDTIPNQAIAAGVGCASIKTPLFAMSNTLCPGVSTTLTANTGTQSPSTYGWISTPAGAIFSAPSASATAVSFTNAGTYNITLVTISGTVFGTTTDTVKAYPGPFVTLLSSSPSVCPGQQFTLTAISLLADTSYTFLSPSGATVSSAYLPVIGLTNPCTYTVWATFLGCLTQDTLTVGETSFTPTLSSSSTSICAGSSVTLTGNGGGSASYSYTFMTMSGTVINNLICSSCGPIQVVSPTVSTRYVVIASSAAGCTDSTSLFLKVLPHSPITAAASSTVICPGTLTYLYPAGPGTSAAVSYTWAGGGLVIISPGSTPATVGVTPYISSIYTVTIVNANGCRGSSSILIKVDSTLALPIQVSASSSVICPGGTATLMATSNVNPIVNITYSWTSVAGPVLTGSAIVVSPAASTTYSVMGSDNVGCNGYSQLTVVAAACVGIEQYGSMDPEFSVYPNPTNEQLFVRSETFGQVTIKLVDPLGKSILTESTILKEGNSDYALNMQNIPPGIYFVKLSVDNQQARRIRVVKQ